MDPLSQTLEKLSAADHHLTNLTAEANQREKHLASITATANQQKAPLATVSIKEDQQQKYSAAISAKTDQQRVDLTALGVKTNSKSQNFGRKFYKKFNNKSSLYKRSWKNKNQYWRIKWRYGKSRRQFQRYWKNDSARWKEDLRQSSTMGQMVSDRQQWQLGNQAIPTFDGTGPWVLSDKQFEATAAHNQWSNMKKSVALTMYLKRVAQQVTIEYATLVNCLEQRFGQKHIAPVKRWELGNHIQKPGEGLQDYVADIRCLVWETCPSMDLEFVESAAVDGFVDGIWDWEVQSLSACSPASLQHWLMPWKLKQQEEHLQTCYGT